MNRLLQSVHALLRSFRLWATVGGLAITALAILVLLGHVPMPAVQTFDRLNQDHRLRWQPPEFEPRVLIVDIDENGITRGDPELTAHGRRDHEFTTVHDLDPLCFHLH